MPTRETPPPSTSNSGSPTCAGAVASSDRTIIGVTGHRDIDPSCLPPIRAEISALLARAAESGSVRVTAVSCLADGADQLFARSAVDAGAELVALIPCGNYEPTMSPHGLDEYRELLGLASQVRRLPFDEPDDAAFGAAGDALVEMVDEIVAIWDGGPSLGAGGTADVVRVATDLGKRVTVLWPDGSRRSGTGSRDGQ